MNLAKFLEKPLLQNSSGAASKEIYSDLGLAKLGKPTVLPVLFSLIHFVKSIFIENIFMGWNIDLFFKRNYEPVMKDHCLGILSCSSKGRKSIKMSKSAGKTENLFYKIPSGSLFTVKKIRNYYFKTFCFVLVGFYVYIINFADNLTFRLSHELLVNFHN